MLFNLLLALLEGIGIILSPCILPILPILFVTGLSGKQLKPYGLILGFITAFCLFTLFARVLILSSGINLDWIRTLSFILLFCLAMVLISSHLSRLFSRLTQKIASFGASWLGDLSQQTGFLSGFLTGLPIGLIWTPCAGPIIAAVILQTVRAQTNFETTLTLLVFSLGVGLPLLLIILFGKKQLTHSNMLNKYSDSVPKILGGILLLTLVIDMRGGLVVPETKGSFDLAKLEHKGLVEGIKPYPAPELKGLSAWINSPPLTLAALKGRVVLIDFWTYSCINCIRTLAYMEHWYQTYEAEGFVLIGIHSPEFAFEQSYSNVKQAVEKYQLTYPIALDNQFQTWDNYANHYWPAHYLINKQGEIVYTHFGEGSYEITEHNIRVLLGSKSQLKQMKNKPEQKRNAGLTAETYLGSARRERLANPNADARSEYHFHGLLQQNDWALQGRWETKEQNIKSLQAKASLFLHFHAQRVYLVLSSSDGQPKTASLFLNGQPLSSSKAGKEVHGHQIRVKEARLYELIHLPSISNGILELRSQSEGLEAYVFTFG